MIAKRGDLRQIGLCCVRTDGPEVYESWMSFCLPRAGVTVEPLGGVLKRWQLDVGLHVCHQASASGICLQAGDVFSVQSLCSLCLCGCCISLAYNHRDTENTKFAQSILKSYWASLFVLPVASAESALPHNTAPFFLSAPLTAQRLRRVRLRQT